MVNDKKGWLGDRLVYVLGVDPGTTTGLSLVRFDLNDQGRPGAIWSDQLDWYEATQVVRARLVELGRLAGAGQGHTYAAAVCEKFTITATTAQRGQRGAEDALGMNGVVRRECALTSVELAPLQQMSAATKLVKDDALRRLRLYSPGQVHANDASRHAVLLAVKRKWMASRFLLPAGA